MPMLLKLYYRNYFFTKFGLITKCSYLHSLFTFRYFNYLIIIKQILAICHNIDDRPSKK